MSSKRAEIKVVGSVQGVFFRAGVKAEAERLGLSGWARNEPDGTVNLHTKRALRFARIFFCARYGVGVKIMAEGEEESLQKLVEWAKLGTEFSRIDKVEVEWKEAEGGFTDFSIK